MTAVAAALLLTTLACRKEGAAYSPVAALLPADTAAKLSPGLLTFADELPAGLDAFGYADAGQTFEQLMGGNDELDEHRALYADLTEMARRRWGMDLRQLSGVGFVVHQLSPLLVVVAPSAPPKGGEPAGLALGQLGKLTVLGKPEAVAALLATKEKEGRLYQGNARWVRSALGRAAGNRAFVTLDMAKALALAPEDIREMTGDALDATLTVGASGVAVAVTCKPNGVGKLRDAAAQGLGMARRAVASQLTRLPLEPQPGPILAALLRHYSDALWKSIEQNVEGDQLVISERSATPG